MRERVADKIDELVASGKESAFREYYKDMREKRDEVRKLDHVQCDTNFLDFNVDLARNLDIYKFNQAQTRFLLDEKIQNNNHRREMIEHEKFQRNSFTLIKWDHFRERRDIAKDNYIDVKRTQMNIEWWLHIISRWRHIKMLSNKYET